VVGADPYGPPVTSTPVLFIGGAGLPAWIWDDVRAGLDAPSAVAQRPSTQDASLDTYARSALETAPSDRFVVVAHSAGGVVATRLLGIAADRVQGLVALAAVLPRPGHSFVRSMPLPNRLVLSAIMRIAGTRPPESSVRSSLAGGLPKETQDRLVADLVPESQRYFRDPAVPWVAPEDSLYVPTQRDKELPDELQHRFGERLTAISTPLQTGHLPMLEDPPAVAAAIGSLVGPDQAPST
jgi:pimeloyl-ACP methyl ester carboxylesterase